MRVNHARDYSRTLSNCTPAERRLVKAIHSRVHDTDIKTTGYKTIEWAYNSRKMILRTTKG